MAAKRLAWRFRKGSGADPVKVLDCGCKVWVYDGTVVRPCKDHDPIKDILDDESEAMK